MFCFFQTVSTVFRRRFQIAVFVFCSFQTVCQVFQIEVSCFCSFRAFLPFFARFFRRRCCVLYISNCFYGFSPEFFYYVTTVRAGVGRYFFSLRATTWGGERGHLKFLTIFSLRSIWTIPKDKRIIFEVSTINIR